MLGHNITLRLKLSDFIEHEGEKLIIDLINSAYKVIHFKLHLWYEEDTIKPKLLKDFVAKYEKELHFRTKITNSSKLNRNEFIWYDILPYSNSVDSGTWRFKYCYSDVKTFEGLDDGLNQFKSTLEFCSKPKSDRPIRKQKRND